MRTRRAVCTLLAVSLSGLSVCAPAHAGLVSTRQLLQSQGERGTQARLHQLLERQAVRSRLVQLGVDPARVEQRLAALTPEEARRLEQRIDSLPAGGDIIGAAVLVFLVLLFTDIMGFTDVFPFVKKTAR